MNIRYFEKRPGAWHLDFRLPSGARVRPYGGPTEAAARTAAPSIVAAALASHPASGTLPQRAAPRAGGMTIEQAYRKGLQVREQWIKSKDKTSLQVTFDNLGLPSDTPCAKLTRDFVRDLRGQWMREPGKRPGTLLSPSTINHRLSMLSVLLEVADLPPHGVRHLSVKGSRRTRRISDGEVEQALAWCAAHAGRQGARALADMIVLALDTCAREGELLDLTWVNVRDGTVEFVDTKNGESRTVPLTPRAASILEARRALPAPFSDLSQGRLINLWSDMRKAIGLASDDEFVFHTLRHEGISRLVDRGVNPFVIQAIAGHSNITTTQVYAHASLGAMRAAVAPERGATLVPFPERGSSPRRAA